MTNLEAHPTEAAAHAQAAVAYATTDARGMTVLWATEYLALGGDEASRGAVSQAANLALAAGVVVRARSDGKFEADLKLAPGGIPVLLTDDGTQAPVLHVFELTSRIRCSDRRGTRLGASTPIHANAGADAG